LRQSLVQVKNCTTPEKKNHVVYEIPCKDFEHVYIEEMRRILEKSDGAYINCQNTPGWL